MQESEWVTHEAWIAHTGVDEDVWLNLIGQFAFLTASFHFGEDIISGVLLSEHVVLYPHWEAREEALKYCIFPSGINAREGLK